MTDTREPALRAWVSQQLDGALIAEWSTIAGDASTRRYFRAVAGDASFVAMDAPPDTEKNAEFRQVRGILDDAGLCVPAELAVDMDRGFLLLGDLGNRLLLNELDAGTVTRLYGAALSTLSELQTVDCSGLPAYSEEVLLEELGRFGEWFCAALLGRPPGHDSALLEDFSGELVSSALEQPVVFVHRDYHRRNLL